ncbi:MAG: NAD-dependent epimerase/dehydratase family protein [Microbacteriaceae bacterium]
MKVLVVGGSGFIGTRLIEVLLERGHTVTNFDSAPSSPTNPTNPTASGTAIHVSGDVRDTAALTLAASGHNAIVNLAAAHRDDVQPVSLYTEINVDGARSVCEAASAAGIPRIVFTSSVAIYGLDKVNPTEEFEPDPFNEYGRTKLAAEKVFTTWAGDDDSRSLAIIRPSVVFGEGNRGNVHTLAAQVASGRFIQVGDGKNRKSMSYVGNIVEFLANSLESPAGTRITNFADKPDLSTAELVALLRETLGRTRGSSIRLPLAVGVFAGHCFDALGTITGRQFAISAIRMRKFAAETTVGTERLEATGFRPRYTLEESLTRTLATEFPHLAHTPPSSKD